MKKKYETRYFVTAVASIPVVRMYGKTEMYRQAAKDGWGVVYRDETNTLICDEDSSADFYTKNGGYYGLSGNDEVIVKEMPKQPECAAIITSDSCGFTFWAEDISRIHFFVTYDANGLVDSYRIEYGDGPIYDGEVEVPFEELFELPEGDWQETYRVNLLGTVEYQSKQEADKLAEESGETWMDNEQREQFRQVCGRIDRIKSARDFLCTMQLLEYDFDKKIINSARKFKKCFNFAQYEQPQEVACREELMESYVKYALVMEYAIGAGAETMQIAYCAGTSRTTLAVYDTTLAEEEVKFFNDTVAKIKYSVNVRVPIEIMNHEQLTGKHKEALGICWAEDNGTGKPVPTRITIDEFFIHECFVALEKPYMKLEPETLEQVIAHEIAHLHVWRHGKKHAELTKHICRLIEKGEPHGLEDSAAPPACKAGNVAMAAMQSSANGKAAPKQAESAVEHDGRTSIRYAIFEGNMERLEKKMVRIRNKCRGYGCDLRFGIVGEEFRELKDESGEKYTARFVIVEAEGVAIVGGWKFIAAVEHTAKGNIINRVCDVEVPERYYTGQPVCEHCNSRRARKDTYIIMHEETGAFKQVGKSCLHDFTRGMSAKAVAQYTAAFESLIEGEQPCGGCRYERYVSTEDWLCYVAETIRHFGYVKQNYDGEISTRSRAGDYYDFDHGGTFNSKTANRIIYEMDSCGFNANSAEAKSEVAAALAWLAEQPESNNYIHNLKTACSLAYISEKRFGITASLFPAYNRELEREAERRQREKGAQASEWVGSIGRRVEVAVSKITCLTSWETQWGYTKIYEIIDDSGNIFIWKTSNWLEYGVKIIKGTVKAHNDYKGVKQTVITRCKCTA